MYFTIIELQLWHEILVYNQVTTLDLLTPDEHTLEFDYGEKNRINFRLS